jgi:hypothetical protein
VRKPENNSHVYLVVVLIAMCLVMQSCKAESRGRSIALKGNGIAKPGVGIDGCSIGQPVSTLDIAFEQGTAARSGEWICKSCGIVASSQKDEVSSVTVIYNVERWGDLITNPFRGSIAKGLNGASTIQEVMKLYGEPIAISAVRDEEGNRVRLNYSTLGVSFHFIDDVLSEVTILMPRPYDPNIDFDVGDSTQIRELAPH